MRASGHGGCCAVTSAGNAVIAVNCLKCDHRVYHAIKGDSRLAYANSECVRHRRLGCYFNRHGIISVMLISSTLNT